MKKNLLITALSILLALTKGVYSHAQEPAPVEPPKDAATIAEQERIRREGRLQEVVAKFEEGKIRMDNRLKNRQK